MKHVVPHSVSTGKQLRCTMASGAGGANSEAHPRKLWPPSELDTPECARVARDDILVRDTGEPRGLGAFARVAIPKGTHLGFYRGELLSGAAEARARGGKYLLSLDGGNCIDGADAAHNDWTARMNDARETGAKVNTVLLSHNAAVLTICDIAAGDELLLDYGEAYWAGTPLARTTDSSKLMATARALLLAPYKPLGAEPSRS